MSNALQHDKMLTIKFCQSLLQHKLLPWRQRFGREASDGLLYLLHGKFGRARLEVGNINRGRMT